MADITATCHTTNGDFQGLNKIHVEQVSRSNTCITQVRLSVRVEYLHVRIAEISGSTSFEALVQDL